MDKLFCGAAAGALISALAAMPVLAQTDSSGTSGATTEQASEAASNAAGQSGSTDKMADGEVSGGGAMDITCREITTMEPALVPGVLYYISGYAAANDGGSMSGTASDPVVTVEGASPAGESTGATDSAAAGEAADGDGAADTPGSSGTQSGQSTTAAGATDGMMQVTGVPGFFEIPVEETFVLCGAAPDSKAVDVLRQQQSSGTGTAKN